jgi:hypothetical protein
MPTFHSLATVPKTIYAKDFNGAVPLNVPLTYTISDTTKATLTPAADGMSVQVTCSVPATNVPIPLTLTAHAPVGTTTGICGVTFDPDPSIVTSITLAETP